MRDTIQRVHRSLVPRSMSTFLSLWYKMLERFMPFDGAKFKFSEVTCYRFRVRVMDGMLIIDDGDGVEY